MKKFVIILMVFGFLAFIPEKKYNVSLSVEEWQRSLNIIEATKNVLKASNAPANVVLPLVDSLSKIQNQFVTQLQSQLDTTKKK